MDIHITANEPSSAVATSKETQVCPHCGCTGDMLVAVQEYGDLVLAFDNCLDGDELRIAGHWIRDELQSELPQG